VSAGSIVDRDGTGRFAGPEYRDVVAPALERALRLAADAGEWRLVADLAAELARRTAASSTGFTAMVAPWPTAPAAPPKTSMGCTPPLTSASADLGNASGSIIDPADDHPGRNAVG